MPNHVISRFVVVDYYCFSVILKIYLFCEFLIELLGLASHLADTFGDRYLGFRIGAMRPVILISQIGHPYVFIEKILLVFDFCFWRIALELLFLCL